MRRALTCRLRGTHASHSSTLATPPPFWPTPSLLLATSFPPLRYALTHSRSHSLARFDTTKEILAEPNYANKGSIAPFDDDDAPGDLSHGSALTLPPRTPPSSSFAAAGGGGANSSQHNSYNNGGGNGAGGSSSGAQALPSSASLSFGGGGNGGAGGSHSPSLGKSDRRVASSASLGAGGGSGSGIGSGGAQGSGHRVSASQASLLASQSSGPGADRKKHKMSFGFFKKKGSKDGRDDREDSAHFARLEV